MKKFLPLVTCIVLFSCKAFAQNVGIGTNNPQTKLDINGALSARVTSLAGIGGTITIPDNVTLFRLTNSSGGGVNSLTITNPKEGQLLIIMNEDDNAATINGYTIPAGTSGNPSVGNFINIGGVAAGWKTTADNNTGSNLFTPGTGLSWSGNTLNSVWTQTGTDISNNNASGRVGIGTNTPAGTLDVQGGTASGNNNGSNINLSAQHGGGTGSNGGIINITGGNGTTGGNAGNVNISSGASPTGSSVNINLSGGNINMANGTADQTIGIANNAAGTKTITIGGTSTNSATTINAGSTGGVKVTTLTGGGVVKATAGTGLLSTGAVNLNSSEVTGTLPAGNLPNLSGDVTGAVNNNTIAANAVNSGKIADGSVSNADLANSSVTITPGTGMSGGGSVALGGSVTLTNAGVTSIVAGTNVTVSGATGAVTVNASGSGLTGASTVNYVPKWTTTNASSGTLSNNTSSIYDNGNVGIGTTGPGQKLEVNGNTLIHNGGTVYNNSGAAELHIGYGLATSATPGEVSRLALQPYGHTGGPFKLVNRDDASSAYMDIRYGTTNLMSMIHSGNVGIGIQNPARTLDVNGATRMRDWLSFGSSDDIGRITWGGGDRFYINAFANKKLSLGSNGNVDQLLIDNSGNVGINNPSPSAKLDVNGNSFLKTLNQGYNSTQRFFPNVVSDAVDNDVTGAWIIHTPIARASTEMFTIRVHGYGYGAGDVIDFTISGYAYSGATGSVDGVAGAVVAYELSDIGTDEWNKYIGIDANGKVAIAFGDIANTAYFYRLAVDCWVSRYGSDVATGWSIDRNTTSGFNWLDKHGPLTSGTGLWSRNSGSGYTYNSWQSDNVGIGTTTPVAHLEIEGPSANWSETTPGLTTGSLHLDPASGTDHHGSAITWGASDSGDGDNAQAGIYVRSDGSYGTKMYFGTTDSYASGSKTRMFIGSTGNVGIGAVNPSIKLKIAGDVESDGQIRATGWITGTGTGAGAEIGVASGIAYYLGYNRTAGAYIPTRLVGSTIDLRHSDASTDLFINSSGNVGIKTASPTEALSVNGALTTQNGQVKRDFFTWNSTASSNTSPIHIKTNIPFTCIMYRFVVEGYQYALSVPIYCETVGYADCNPTPTAVTHNTNWYYTGTYTTCSAYKSSDGYLVLRVDPSTASSSSNYYIGFAVSVWLTNPAGNGFDVKVTNYGQTAY